MTCFVCRLSVPGRHGEPVKPRWLQGNANNRPLRGAHEYATAWSGVITVGEIRGQRAWVSAFHPHPQLATPLRLVGGAFIGGTRMQQRVVIDELNVADFELEIASKLR